MYAGRRCMPVSTKSNRNVVHQTFIERACLVYIVRRAKIQHPGRFGYRSTPQTGTSISILRTAFPADRSRRPSRKSNRSAPAHRKPDRRTKSEKGQRNAIAKPPPDLSGSQRTFLTTRGNVPRWKPTRVFHSVPNGASIRRSNWA